MNRKGFTLIELLAIIVIIALVAVIVSPSIIGLFNTSKDKLYNIMIEDIKTAGENYYLECENGDLSNQRYGDMACSISNNTTTVSLGNLVKLGLLKSSSNNSTAINPKNKKDIGNCSIEIRKVVSDNYKTSFIINIPEECLNN